MTGSDSFLGMNNRTVVVFGLGNRKSIAWAIGSGLEAVGAKVVYGVRNDARKQELSKLLGNRSSVICDVSDPKEIESVACDVHRQFGSIHGLVHSIAFANYTDGFKPFHETRRDDFLEAMQISAFSLVELARAFKPTFAPDASVVTIGISSYVTAAQYGYMSPIKATLEGCVRFLAKSFSSDSSVRFNSVNAGPLKTRSSAGIPGYLKNYLFAEKMTYRKRAITTREVADAAIFLLSPRASGINAQGLVVNAGMDFNYFDEEIVDLAMRTTP